MNQLTSNGYNICMCYMCWLTGHANIQGNEDADRAAKKALNCDVEPCLIPHSDLKPLIATHIKVKWQLEWMKALTNCMELNRLWGNLHRFIQVIGGIK